MSEWQPVRIAPRIQAEFGHPGVEFYSTYDAMVGKTVRVKRIAGGICEWCEGAVYQVHPDDDFGDPEEVLCEHQIQAD